MKEVAVVLLCYLLGSIPFSYLITRILTKEDIRTKGSGNVGATNVLRTSGMKVALPALAGDILKGFVAVWIGFILVGKSPVIMFCGLAAVLGHIYPVFLKFKGGKGVATAAGVLLYLMPAVLGILVVIFALIVAVTRYVSLGSIISAVLLPILSGLTGRPWYYTVLAIILALLVIYHHRKNIGRLKSGTEAKIGQRVA